MEANELQKKRILLPSCQHLARASWGFQAEKRKEARRKTCTSSRSSPLFHPSHLPSPFPPSSAPPDRHRQPNTSGKTTHTTLHRARTTLSAKLPTRTSSAPHKTPPFRPPLLYSTPPNESRLTPIKPPPRPIRPHRVFLIARLRRHAVDIRRRVCGRGGRRGGLVALGRWGRERRHGCGAGGREAGGLRGWRDRRGGGTGKGVGGWG